MKQIAFAGLSLVFLVGCTPSDPTHPPEVVPFRTPVDADAGIRDTHYHNVVRGYSKRDVVAPTSWRDRNVDPAPVIEPRS